MSDPLSIAGSVVGLISLGLQCAEYLYNYYTTYRDRRQDLAQIADQLGSLLDSLRIIDEVVRTRKRRPNNQGIAQCIEDAIDRSERIIYILRDEVDKFKKEPTDDWKRKVLVTGREAIYLFKQSILEDLGKDVVRFHNNLSTALEALDLREHQNTQDDIEAVKAIVKSIQAYNISLGIRQWL